MSPKRMTEPQLIAMLEALPASCVYDAIEKIKPQLSVDYARFVLLNFESQGVVSWKREAPQAIQLTKRGQIFLKELKS